MDPIKEAFNKIKEDILLLKNEINNLNKRLNEVQTTPTHNQPISTQQTNKPATSTATTEQKLKGISSNKHRNNPTTITTCRTHDTPYSHTQSASS